LKCDIGAHELIQGNTLTVSTVGNGSVVIEYDGSTATSGDTIVENKSIELTATPDAGNKFTKWTGDATFCENKTDNPLSFTAPDASVSCTANFVATHAVSATIVDGGSSSVSGLGDYAENETVNLTANAVSGYKFKAWSGHTKCGTGEGVSLNFEMPAEAVACIATFEVAPTRVLTVSKAGTGSGTVGGAGTYEIGTTVNLTAAANSDSRFDGWSGSGCSASFNMPANDLTCTATFTKIAVEPPPPIEPPPPPPPPPEPTFHNLQVEISGSGRFKSDTLGVRCKPDRENCTAYLEGLSVILKPEPGIGYQFKSWSGDCSRSGSVTMDRRKTCRLTFEKLPTFPLFTQVRGTGFGTITSADGNIKCGGVCEASYTADMTVKLTATPFNDRSVFSGWLCSGKESTQNPIEISMFHANTCVATFSALHQLSLQVNTVGGTVSYEDLRCDSESKDCKNLYPSGEIQVNSHPEPGYVAQWGAECPEGKLLLDGDKNCSIDFVPAYDLNLHLGGDGAGKITSIPAGIECSSGSCTASYIQNSVLQLVATPEFGSSFVAWSGDCVDGQTNLVMNAHKTCSVEFARTGTPQFSQEIYTVKETDGIVNITVNREQGSSGELQVNYIISDGSATYSYDYTGHQVGSLYWADGDAEPKNFSIPIVIDADAEPTETILLKLVDKTNFVIHEAEVQILDIFVPSKLSFVTHQFTAIDTDEELSFMVARGVSFTDVAQVDFVVTAGEVILSQGTLRWAAEEMQNKFIKMSIGAALGHKVLQAKLLNPQPEHLAELGTHDTATLTIKETPIAGAVSFNEAEYSMPEGRRAIIGVERSGELHTAASVDFVLLDGTASPGTDYIAQNGILQWKAHEGGKKFFDIRLLNNDIVEEQDRTILLQLQNPQGTSLGSITQAVFYILDATATPGTSGGTEPPTQPPIPPKEGLGTVEFELGEYSVYENAGELNVQVLRKDGIGTISVRVRSVDVDAQAGHDYTPIDQELRWINEDDTGREIKIGLMNNARVDGNKVFKLELIDEIGIVGEIATAHILIMDDDSSQIHFQQPNYTIREDQRQVVLQIVRSGSALDSAQVNYHTENITARASKDYAAVSGSVEWTAGDTGARNISIPIIDNNDINSSREFAIILQQVGSAQVIAPNRAVVSIEDDDILRIKPVVNPDTGNTLIDGHVSNYKPSIGAIGKTTYISPRGSVTSTRLEGYIDNEGVLKDIILGPGAIINGGRLEGSITGDPSRVAELRQVEIASKTGLSNVLIGTGSKVAHDVILGENVRFTENTIIPATDLTPITGYIVPETPVKEFFAPKFAVNLRTDVIINPSVNNILGSINGLQEFIEHGVQMQQDSETGLLVLHLDNMAYPLLPLQLRQILPEQLRDNKPHVGLHVSHTGEVVFVTHTGRYVYAVPMLYAPQEFLAEVTNLGLGTAGITANGQVQINLSELEYLQLRPSLLSSKTDMNYLGIAYVPSVYVDGVHEMLFVYQAPDEVIREQKLYPAAVDDEALRTLAAQVEIYMDGRVEIFNASGQLEHSGQLGYNVLRGTKGGGKMLIEAIGDVNADGKTDYHLTYPNGDRQVLYGFFKT
jgi:hypothetical protein